MADRMSKEVRGMLMSHIRSRDTRTELAVRSFLHREGLRFRVCDRQLPGSPDVVFPNYRVAVFVHGYFWHGYGCRRTRVPKSNIRYWVEKMRRNQERDRAVIKSLRSMVWKAIIIWECEINEKMLCGLTKRIRANGKG